MENRNEICGKASKLLSLHRRQLARQSPEAFANVYLAHYYKFKPSRMHRELMALLHPDKLLPGSKLAIAAPRGHAKSTLVSLALVLYCVCYGLERFIVLISSTMDQAEPLLKHIKDELSGNALLLQDFHEVCEPSGNLPGSPRWTQSELITRNDVKVSAVSANTKLRGRRHKDQRPGLVICDDLETDSGVASEVQRRSLEEWFFRAVLICGTPATRFIVVGTVLHYDALLARLIDPIKSASWTSGKYQAIEAWDDHPELWEKWATIYNHQEEWEGASGPDPARRYYEQNAAKMLQGSRVLWPELEDYYKLKELCLTSGQARFDSEKQNEPIDAASCLFPEHSMHFWDDRFKSEEELLASLGEGSVFYGACDPSMGKAGKNRDDTAIITLVRDSRTGLLYILDAQIARLGPSRIIEHVIDYQMRWKYREFAMEATQYQEYLAQDLIKRSRIRGCPVNVRAVKPATDKMARIQSLQPKVCNGTILFCRRHRTLLDQLRQFPKAAHDDGPDALHMAVELATTPRLRAGITWARRQPIAPGSNTYILVPDDDDDEKGRENEFQRRLREFIRS